MEKGFFSQEIKIQPMTDPTCDFDSAKTMIWYVYIIHCSNNSLYTGITTDPERRFRQHSDGKGAKYFRGRRPLKIVYLEGDHSRSSAGIRELQIKRMTHGDKYALIAAAA